MEPRCGYRLHNLYVYMCEECNLACRHCWQSANRTPRTQTKPVSVDTCRMVIDEAIPLGLGYVKISGGEPLLRKADVIELIEHTHGRRVSTRLETNGTLIDDEVADAISRCRVATSVSLDGATASTHEKLRLTRGCFDQTITALARLQSRGVRTELVFSLHRDNQEDLPGVVALAARFGCSGVKINPVISSGRASQMNTRGALLSATELLEFVRQVERTYCGRSPRVSVSTAPAFHSLRSTCAGQSAGGHCSFKHLLGILADGRVSFCGMGYRSRDYIFARAADARLDEVWNDHPQLDVMRKQLPQSLEGVCGNCVARSSCQGGCRAEAYEVYGSLMAPSPSCQQLYDAGLFPNQRLVAARQDCSYRPIHST